MSTWMIRRCPSPAMAADIGARARARNRERAGASPQPMTKGEDMLRQLAGTMLAGAVRQVPGSEAGDPLASTLIGTGATLALTRGRRPIGIVLLAAGGYLLWRDVAKARRAAALMPPSAARQVPSASPAAT